MPGKLMHWTLLNSQEHYDLVTAFLKHKPYANLIMTVILKLVKSLAP
jgi:hypothetical protein